jgi:hypothetical protein
MKKSAKWIAGVILMFFMTISGLVGSIIFREEIIGMDWVVRLAICSLAIGVVILGYYLIVSSKDYRAIMDRKDGK